MTHPAARIQRQALEIAGNFWVKAVGSSGPPMAACNDAKVEG